MKNRIFSLVLLIAIVISAVSGLVACVPSGEPTQLKAPSVTLIDNVVHWTSVEGATGYEISIGLAVTTVGKDVTSQVLELGDSFMVRAVGDGEKYLTSAWSSTITYGEKPADPGKEALATPVVTLSGDVASWGAVDGAVGYEVSIGASTVITLDANTTAYTLTLGQSIVVRAMAAAGAEKTHSAWSAIVKYTDGGVTSCTHADEDENGKCDSCQISVVVVVDFYSINDLHGKFCDSDTQPGVDELASYLKGRENIDDNVVVLSAGDMWQGTAESSLTYGKLMTEWMNIIGTVGMTLGNHEYDWGESYIRENLKIADFPFLALNIYNRSTGKLADYCTPSIIIEEGGIEIGIIGAIGDCYSSILSDMVKDVEFKTGNTLTALVKAESERLRALGADIIVYSLHDSTTGCDASLSAGGYVDLVFEGHSHTSYCTKDAGGVYHIQAGGENKGISHAELSYNIVTKKLTTTEANIISSSTYSAYEDDPETEALEDKYGEIIELVTKPLGKVGKNLSDSEVEDIVAELYFKAGQEKWGDDYAITLGGGFLKTRSPYDLAAGTVTYGDLVSLLPFNNQLVLCSIKGSDLLSRFIETENGDYHVYYEIQASSIVSSAIYYVVVDTYTSAYAANRLTVIERYDETTFARDLFAEYIEAGGLDNAHKNCSEKTITEVIELGSQMSLGSFTTIPYHVTGIIKSISNATSGIL